ncbi:MAG: pirin [Marivirga sp.]|nr:pirin [Marivirga sp.]
MLPKTEATIYLASQRGCSQTEWFRSYHTFNFDKYFTEHRKPFGCLKVLNDDTLKGLSTRKHIVQEDTLIVLLPIVGACEYRDSGIQGMADAGQSVFFPVYKDSEFEISNPYKDELINYLYIELSGDRSLNATSTVVSFDLDNNRNKLIPLFSNQRTIHRNLSIYLGKFGGREEGIYTLKDPFKGIFVFIIEGAFEVQNRLLQARDGLALRGTDHVEFEALSNDAIILVIEPMGAR